MYKVIKKIIPQPIKKILRPLKYLTIRDTSDTLLYIHIGKCGGETLMNALNKSVKLKKNFSKIYRIHVSRPPIKKNCKYLILIRNPIQRLISAFNGRYMTVIENKSQIHRFKHELEILTRFKSLDEMGRALYKNGKLNKSVAKQMKHLHHFKEDISFYLKDLLKKIRPEQIYGVLSTETLNQDIKNILGVDNTLILHENSSKIISKNKKLSPSAYNNIKKFMEDDYRCLNYLLSINQTTLSSKDELLK